MSTVQFRPLRFSFHKKFVSECEPTNIWAWALDSCRVMLTFKSRQKKKKKKTKRKLFFFIQLLLCCLCFTCYALHDVFVVWRMRVRVLIVLDALLFHSLLFENWVWFNLIKGDGQVDLLLLFRCPLSAAPFLYRYLVNFSFYSFSGPDMLRKYHTQYPFTITHTYIHTNQTHTHSSQDIYYSENKKKIEKKRERTEVSST